MAPMLHPSRLLFLGRPPVRRSLAIVLSVTGSTAALLACGSPSQQPASSNGPVTEHNVVSRVTTWPMWGFGAARTRVGPNVGPPSGKPVWVVTEMVGQFGDLIEYPPSIAGGSLFYCTNGGGQGGQVVARRLTDGSELWRFRVSGGGQLAAEPAVGGDVIYIGTMGPHKGRGSTAYKPELLALKADSSNPAGQLVWSAPIGRAIESSPSRWLPPRLPTTTSTCYC